MISSLRSRFDLFDRRAIYITGDKIAVYHWRSGGLADGFLFEATDVGFGQFAHYLEESPNVPVYLVVDVVEEEYRQDTIPHVFGRDRGAIIQRKLLRLFRNTPYQYAQVQGREVEGRKDDRLLLTALTNPDQLDPLIRLFSDNKVPVTGIYSLPVISELLLDKLGTKSSNLLLVTLHGASGLRQTFFRDQELKVSRLAKMPRYGSVPYAPHVLGELDKFRRYLVSLRLLNRDAPLDIFVVTGGDLLGELKHQTRTVEQVRFHLVNVAEVGRRLGISGALTTPYSDVLFAHLLLDEKPVNQYAPKHQTRYYRLFKTRVGMMAAAALLLLGGSVWSGFNFIEGVSLRHQAFDSQQKAAYYQARYEIARKRLPPTAVEPRDIKSAVDIVDALARHRARPIEMMRTVSLALGGFQTVELDRIEWIASPDPNAQLDAAETTAGAEQATRGPADPGVLQSEPPKSYLYYHVAEVQGHIEPFDGNYRGAIATVNRFEEALRNQENVYRVEVIRQPLDVSSSANLRGASDAPVTGERADFLVRLVMGIADEKA
ncbi:MAG: hypothetical protein ACT4NU_07095 [Chromatiales bacterium]